MRLCVISVLSLAAPAGLLGDPPPEKPTPERVAQLVKQLGHARFAVREAASNELEAVGEPALVALRTATSDSDPEIARRAGLVIQAISRRVTRRELKALQGEWSLHSYEMDGMRIKGEDKSHVFTFKDGRWSLKVGGQLFQAGTVERIEVKEKLNAIDLLITEGGNIGATAISIYALEAGLLKYLNCGDPRVTEFVTKPGDGRHYLTFRRVQR